jgi:hypothetical protein
MSYEALDTAAIEGEYLDRNSVESSIRRQRGFATDRRSAGRRDPESPKEAANRLWHRGVVPDRRHRWII